MALFFDSPQRFGAAVKHLRKRRGLKLEGLAHDAGVCRASVVRVERGLSPTMDTALASARALGFSLALALGPGQPQETAQGLPDTGKRLLAPREASGSLTEGSASA